MNYMYSGPTTGVTLRLADGTERDVMLHPGATIDLPADHGFVAALVAAAYLTIPPADISVARNDSGPAKRRNTQGSHT